MDIDEPPTAIQSGWGAQSKVGEELQFFTELALQETRRWIEVVTGQEFKYNTDFRGSLEDGILLCKLLNALRPGSIGKINRLPTPIAGLDNINIFLGACQVQFGLKDSQLFHSCDLEDLSIRAVSDSLDQLRLETERRLRNVAITIFWLGKVSKKYNFHGPLLNLSVFADLIHGSHQSSNFISSSATPSSASNISHHWLLSGSTPITSSLNSARESVENILLQPGGVGFAPNESNYSIDHCSAYGSFRSETKSSNIFDDVVTCQGLVEGCACHTKQDSCKSFISDHSVASEYSEEATDNISVRHADMQNRYDDIIETQEEGGSTVTVPRFSTTLDSVYNTDQPPESSSNNNKVEDDYSSHMLSQRTPSQNSLDQLVKENDMLHSRLGTRKSAAHSGPSEAMRFVKTGGVTKMADQAKETVTTMQQQKDKKKSFEVMEEDWTSDLSSWKSKMRKKSTGSLQHAQDSLVMDTGVTGMRQTDLEADTGVQRRISKTFKEMKQEKEQRKSGNYNIYPTDDSEDPSLSSEGFKTRRNNNDDKLLMFGFHKIDKPTDMITHVSSTSSDSFSDRTSALVTEDEPHTEEIAPWGFDEDSDKGTIQQITLPKSTYDPISKADMHISPYEKKTSSLLPPSTSSESQAKNTPVYAKKSESSQNVTSVGFKSARDMFERTSSLPEVRNIPEKVSSVPHMIEVVHEPTHLLGAPVQEEVVHKTVTKSCNNQEAIRTPSGELSGTYVKAETDDFYNSLPSNRKKKHIEKVIRISQKPDHVKGFGFTIHGGKEIPSPIVVEKVILGGAADVCELVPGDEIVAINGALVANHYQQSVQLVINHAVKAGQIELRINRSIDKAKLGLFDEELQMEQEQHMLRSNHHRFKTRQLDVSGEQQHLTTIKSECDHTSHKDSASSPMDQGTRGWNVVPCLEENRANINHPMFSATTDESNEFQVKHLPSHRNDVVTTPHIPLALITSTLGCSEPDEPDEPPPLPTGPPPVPNWTAFPDHEEMKSEEYEWQKIEKQDHLMSHFDQIQTRVPIAVETNHVMKETNHIANEINHVTKDTTCVDANDHHAYQSHNNYVYGNESELIAKLEAEEQIRQHRIDDQQRRDRDQRRSDEMQSWRSMDMKEMLRAGSTVKVVDTDVDNIELHTSHDMETLLQRQPKLNFQSSHKFFDMNVEQDRMQRWMQDQETRLKEKFDRDKEQLQQEQEEDLKRAGEIEYEKKKQEEKLLEKELSHQRELEEIKRQCDAERLQHQNQEETECKERERKEEIVFCKRVHKEEAERKERQQREKIERRQQQQKDEAERHAKKQREESQQQREIELQQQQCNKHKEEQHELEELEKVQMRLDKEHLEHQEQELRAKEGELRQLEAKQMRMIETDQLRRLEELKRFEEEQRMKDEEDRCNAEAIQQKVTELQKLEERLMQEEMKLCLQREQLQMDHKSDTVSRSYNAQMGDIEYIYQHETATPQQIEYPEACGTERTEQYEIRSSPQVTPWVAEPESASPTAKRMVIKREPPIIPQKQGIKSTIRGLSQNDILDMNKKPAGQRGYDDSYQVSPSHVKQQAHRKSWSPEVASHKLSQSSESRPANENYSQARATGMTRQEVMAMNRKTFVRQEFSNPEQDIPRHDKSPSPPSHSMTKRTLHNLGAAPKSRLIASQTWIRAEPKKGAHKSEVVRLSLGTLSENWLVEEAERRRLAKESGHEREAYPNRQDQVPFEYGEDVLDCDILAPPQGYQLSRLSRSWQGSHEQTPSRISPSRSVGDWEGQRESSQRSQFSYSQKAVPMSTFRSPKRVTEHERPEYYDIPQRPIPQDIMQSLLDGVSSTHKMYATSSPQGQSSSTYAICAPSSPSCAQTRTNSHLLHPQTVPQHLPPHQPQLHQVSQYSNNNHYQYPLIVQHTSQSEQCLSHPHKNSRSKGNSQSPQNMPQYCPGLSQYSSNQQQYSTNQLQYSSNQLQYNSNKQYQPQYSSFKSMQNQPKFQYSQSPSIMQRSRQGPPEPPVSSGHPWYSTLPNMHISVCHSPYHHTGPPGNAPGQLVDRPLSSSGSIQSNEGVPPVPPKPPRLLSTSSEESAEQVVSLV